MSLEPGDVVIDDGSPDNFPDMGLIPRDYSAFPEGYYAPTFESLNLPTWEDDRIRESLKEAKATGTRLVDRLDTGDNGQPIKCYYQNGYGYCWAYSTGHGVTAIRAAMGLPYVKLSPFAVAHIIKKGRDEGGWSALSLEWVMANGIPSQDLWPNLKAGLNQDTPAMRADAAKYKVSEGWVEINASVYNRNIAWQAVKTLLAARVPVMADYYFMRHAVCLVELVEDAGQFGVRYWNSHKEGTPDRSNIIMGNRAIPNGAVAPRAMALAH